MTTINPGLQKGYALDFGSPVRYVAEALRAGHRSLEALVEGYSHDPEELARVWEHELRKPRERKRSKGGQPEREAQAKRWLVERAIEAFGEQVRRQGDAFELAVAFDDLRVGGLPLPGSAPFARAAAVEQARRRLRARARGPGRKPTHASTPAAGAMTEPSTGGQSERTSTTAPEAAVADTEDVVPESFLAKWLREHGHTPSSLAAALEVEAREVEGYLDGSRELPRVTRLALWALERGAEPGG